MQITSISEVLSILLEQAKIKEAHLAKALNVPRATINKLHTGKILDPRSSTIIAIADYFGITVDQLLGKAPLFGDTLAKFIRIPLVAAEQLKSDKFMAMLNYDKHTNWMLLEYDNDTKHDNLVAIKVTGDAMLPLFDEQTTVVIDTQAMVINRKYVFVYIDKRKELILRQIFIEAGEQILKPLNPLFEGIKLTKSDRIIGVVVQTKREF